MTEAAASPMGRISAAAGRDATRLGPMCWTAVFIGVLVMLIVHFLLNLLGLGIGAAALDASAPDEEASLSGLLYWSAAGIVSSFLGGAIAGRIASEDGYSNAPGHALAAWALSSLLVVAAIGGALGAGSTMLGGPLAGQIAEFNAFAAESSAGVGAGDTVAPTANNVRRDEVEDAIATGALISFVALLIGAAAAWLGARMTAASRGRSAREAGRADILRPGKS